MTEYKQLLNFSLPARYKFPVRFNHCFNRIILDWLFKDCWYNHLSVKQTAISQLSEDQLRLVVTRMNEWLQNHTTLISDNNDSLNYRRKLKKTR